MRGAIAAATLGAGALFLGALALFASFLGGVRWRAFERAPEKLGRVPAIVEPDAPTVLTMTASDVDSVPAGMEARPRPRVAAAAESAPTALGDVEPAGPRPKAGPRKAAVRRPAFFRKVGLGGRPGLQLGSGPSFDGGGSGAFAEGAPPQDEEPGDRPAPAAPAVAAPARARAMRALTPARGTTAPLPARAPAPAAEEPPPDEEGEGEGE